MKVPWYKCMSDQSLTIPAYVVKNMSTFVLQQNILSLNAFTWLLYDNFKYDRYVQRTDMFNWIVFSQTTMVMCESWTKHSKRLISLTCELWFLVSININSDSSLLHLGATLILTEYEIVYVKLLVGLAQWEKATAVAPCFKSAYPVSLLLWDWAVLRTNHSVAHGSPSPFAKWASH